MMYKSKPNPSISVNWTFHCIDIYFIDRKINKCRNLIKQVLRPIRILQRSKVRCNFAFFSKDVSSNRYFVYSLSFLTFPTLARKRETELTQETDISNFPLYYVKPSRYLCDNFVFHRVSLQRIVAANDCKIGFLWF